MGCDLFIFAVKKKLDRGPDEVVQLNRCADLDLSAGYLAIIIVPVDVAATGHITENALPWRIVVKNVQRILTVMKARVTSFRYTIVLMCFAFFELIPTAGHIPIETLKTGYNRHVISTLYLLCFFSFAHCPLQFMPHRG